MSDYNAADRKDVRRAEKAARQAELARGEVVKGLMDTTAGRRYVWDRLSAAHIFVTSFNLDPVQMAFNEGERNQGLQLLGDIMQWCPDLFIQAMRESNERHLAAQRSRSQDGNGGVEGPIDGDPAGEDGRDEDGARERAS